VEFRNVPVLGLGDAVTGGKADPKTVQEMIRQKQEK